MIHLLVLRHGEASFDAPSDDERVLTSKGSADVKHTCSQARKQLGVVDDVFVSPLVRAQQTAHIVCEEINRDKGSLETWPLLKPESDVLELISRLLKHTMQKDALLSGGALEKNNTNKRNPDSLDFAKGGFAAGDFATGDFATGDFAKGDFDSSDLNKNDRTILLVAHQPLVSRLLENFCELNNNPGRSFFSNSSSKYSMGTANLAYVTLDVIASACGTLQWIRTP